MKHRGGVPPVFRKETPAQRAVTVEKRVKELEKKAQSIPPPPPRQTERVGLSQFFKRPKSPFTGPGPATAGRKKVSKTRRRTRHRS